MIIGNEFFYLNVLPKGRKTESLLKQTDGYVVFYKFTMLKHVATPMFF